MHCGEWKEEERWQARKCYEKKLSGLKCDECIEKRMQA